MEKVKLIDTADSPVDFDRRATRWDDLLKSLCLEDDKVAVIEFSSRIERGNSRAQLLKRARALNIKVSSRIKDNSLYVRLK